MKLLAYLVIFVHVYDFGLEMESRHITCKQTLF